MVGLLVALCSVDLLATIAHLDAGGSEANPWMDWLLQVGGVAGFACAKLLATGLGALVLLIHVRFPGVRSALIALVMVYAGLSVWHGVVAVDRWML